MSLSTRQACKAPLAEQDDGIVAKLLVKAGTKDIPVGTPMAVLVEEAEHVAAFKDYQAGQSGAESKPEADAQPSSSGRPRGCSACLLLMTSQKFLTLHRKGGRISRERFLAHFG